MEKTEIELSITNADYMASGKQFMPSRQCPLTMALRRVLGRDDVYGGVRVVSEKEKVYGKSVVIGFLDPPFGYEQYGNLEEACKNGVPYEFKTTFHRII